MSGSKGPADQRGDVVRPVVGDASMGLGGLREERGEDVACVKRGGGSVEGGGPGFEVGLGGAEG